MNIEYYIINKIPVRETLLFELSDDLKFSNFRFFPYLNPSVAFILSTLF